MRRPVSSIGRGPRRATARSAAASPRSASRLGKIPCARSRSSSIAASSSRFELAELRVGRRVAPRPARSRSPCGCAATRGAAARRRAGRARACAARPRSPRRCAGASRAGRSATPSSPRRARRSPAPAARSRPPPAAARAPRRAGRRARSRPPRARRAPPRSAPWPTPAREARRLPARRPSARAAVEEPEPQRRIAERLAQHRLELARRRAPQRFGHHPAQHPPGEQLGGDQREEEAVPDRRPRPDDRPADDREDVGGLRSQRACRPGRPPVTPGRRARPARRSRAHGDAAACRRRGATR